MTDLEALISEIEALKEGDNTRHLQGDILSAAGFKWEDGMDRWVRDSPRAWAYDTCNPLANLQDATLVVPEGVSYRVTCWHHSDGRSHTAQGEVGPFGAIGRFRALLSGKEPAKALTLAALRAIKEKEG